MKKIVIFASGRGTNAEAIYQYSLDGKFQVSAIITDNPEALVIQKAMDWDVPVHVISKDGGESRKDHEKKIISILDTLEFNLIVLAGYERLLSSFFIKSFAKNSIINIHPSLLPAFPGLLSYERAFHEGVKESGITIHYVDEGMDTGKIIHQEKFDRHHHHELEDFKRSGLALEHKHYPRIIEKILSESMVYRFEIFLSSKKLLSNPDRMKGKVFWIETKGPLAKLHTVAKDVLIDPVVEDLYHEHHAEFEEKLKELSFESAIPLEISFLPGVTDNMAFSVRNALLKHPDLRGEEISVHSGTLFFLHGEDEKTLTDKVFKEFANSWLENVVIYNSAVKFKDRFESPLFSKVKLESPGITHYDLSGSDDDLLLLSQKQLWALNLQEMHFIRDHFQKINRRPTDVEMEIIAQTWSEHCKHKIFAATIEHEDTEGKRKIHSLFKTFIKGATTQIIQDRNIDWARSVFTDNAGIVRWDDHLDVCIKVETHNSPSALDPYGGALTGILGVNRDILGCGLGAKPIANTDVFCLPPEDADHDGEWPGELHSPKRLRAGVHKGVQDGGNKSGIPTVNGAFHYHISYAGKPLVYCGTVGVLPHKIGDHESHEKNQRPGDLVVMVGGRIGKDGIHGATFSSLELKEGTPSTVVQIGDPLNQKRMTDFLLKARDLNLYTSITDNGAGGLSSSVGEMCALTNGARIDLALAPVKYSGLSAAELMISESQERMTCSVHPSKWREFHALAELFGVEVTSLGEFTLDGYLTVNYQGEEVAKLSLSFLHDELPPMELKSSWTPDYQRPSWKKEKSKMPLKNIKEKIYALLSHQNVRSHEAFVRQYDHEVKAASVTKPFSPEGGPSDAGVIALFPHGGTKDNGIVISSGLAPQVSLQDTKLMAMYAIDEAVRNAVVTGADPDKMVLIDNFCWPDPLPGPRNPDFAQKLGELVRCNEGLYAMATAFGMPFVSGKDSMKNDAIVQFKGEKIKISVLPTLLITAMGKIKDIKKTVRATFNDDQDLWILGKLGDLHPHTLYEVENRDRENWPSADPSQLIEQYRKFHSAIQENLIQGAHDVSEGGLLIAFIEMAINSGKGFDLFIKDERSLFGEGMGILAFASSKCDQDKIRTSFPDALLVGETRSDETIEVGGNKISLSECIRHYKRGQA